MHFLKPTYKTDLEIYKSCLDSAALWPKKLIEKFLPIFVERCRNILKRKFYIFCIYSVGYQIIFNDLFNDYRNECFYIKSFAKENFYFKIIIIIIQLINHKIFPSRIWHSNLTLLLIKLYIDLIQLSFH